MTEFKTGWLKDGPDQRDFDEKSPKIEELIKTIKGLKDGKPLPPSIDLSPYCTPVEFQDNLGSCTAQAGVALLEYFIRRSEYNEIFEGSRLFLYKVTRKTLNWTGDKGAFLRNTMGAMKLFGVPPERFFPYDITRFDEEPDAFTYSLAQNYKAEHYFTLDPTNTTSEEVLNNVKRYLAAGFPSMFGFTLYLSFNQAGADGTGRIPYPAAHEPVKGGHAVVAIGYDDSIEITNLVDHSKTVGALKIRNSWGAGWGDKGYGWLPYKYVLEKQALDFWTLISAKYVNSNQFGL